MFDEPFAPYTSLYLDMHGLIFETSIWLLVGSTRFHYLKFLQNIFQEAPRMRYCFVPNAWIAQTTKAKKPCNPVLSSSEFTLRPLQSPQNTPQHSFLTNINFINSLDTHDQFLETLKFGAKKLRSEHKIPTDSRTPDRLTQVFCVGYHIMPA